MTSLLERIDLGAAGPIRTTSGNSSRSSTPYNRTTRLPKGDSDAPWAHDMYEAHNSLSARMNIQPTAPKATVNTLAAKALKDAGASTSGLTIKGASSQGNVVEVSGLVAGTTPEDVVAIFQRCGPITQAKAFGGPELRIRVTFKTPSAATAAVQKFDGQQADGKLLKVQIVGQTAVGTTLAGRLGGADGLGLVRQEGSVDVLMETEDDGGSKMRSDSLLNSDRAQVLVAPPGANPKDYVQSRGGRGNRGRAGRRGRRGGAGGKMDVD